MSKGQVLQPGDLIETTCGSPSCTGDHQFVVRRVDGDVVELIVRMSPMATFTVKRSGKRHLVKEDYFKLTLVKVETGAGQEILDRYNAYEELMEEIHAHSYEDLGLKLALDAHRDQVDTLESLAHDRRLGRPTDLAYGVCRLAGIEPTPALLILIACAMRPRGLDILDAFTISLDLRPIVESGVSAPN